MPVYGASTKSKALNSGELIGAPWHGK